MLYKEFPNGYLKNCDKALKLIIVKTQKLH